MKRLFSKITINKKSGEELNISFVNNISIKSTWKEFVDTCEIKFPKKITKDGSPIVVGLNSIFTRGDKIKIELGYFPNLETYFSGYISKIETGSPLTLKCENEMFILKQTTLTKSYKSINLNILIPEIVSDFKTDVVDAELGSLRLTKVTPLQVLEEIKKTYSIESFFKDSVLYSGLAYIPKLTKVFNITFEKNIIDHSLEWQNEDEIKIKLKAISMKPDNSKIEIEVGDADGETRTGHWYNLNEKQLKDIATREISKFRFTGFRGGFVTFGNHKISHGDVINLRSNKFPEQNGYYFVDGVQTEFGMNGFRQNVELGRKAIVGTDFQQDEEIKF